MGPTFCPHLNVFWDPNKEHETESDTVLFFNIMNQVYTMGQLIH